MSTKKTSSRRKKKKRRTLSSSSDDSSSEKALSNPRLSRRVAREAIKEKRGKRKTMGTLPDDGSVELLGTSAPKRSAGATPPPEAVPPKRKKVKRTPEVLKKLKKVKAESDRVKPIKLDSETILITTQDGKEINFPSKGTRYATLYTFTSTTYNQQVDTVLQGPHTLSHVLTDQLLRKKIEQMADFKTEMNDLFNDKNLIPRPEDIIDILGAELPKNNPRYERYLGHYIKEYNALKDILKSNNAIEDIDKLVLDFRALMDLNPFATYGWKTFRNKNSTTKKKSKNQDGKGEGEIDDIDTANLIQLRYEVLKNIDGVKLKGFKEAAGFADYLLNRLKIFFAEDSEIVKEMTSMFDKMVGFSIEKLTLGQAQKLAKEDFEKQQKEQLAATIPQVLSDDE